MLQLTNKYADPKRNVDDLWPLTLNIGHSYSILLSFVADYTGLNGGKSLLKQ